MRGVAARVAEIEAMKPTALKTEWERVHGEQPPLLAASLLARALAFDAQCAAQGGAGEKMRLRLIGMGAARSAPTRTLAPGTQLVREWQGVEHRVTVTDGGFLHQGKPYKSLSAIARAITGSRWNGWIFFGLKNQRART